MLAEAPGTLLDEWAAYYQIEPFGQVRSDLQAGQICTTLQHIAAAKAGIFSEVDASDYVMTFGEEPRDDADQELNEDEAWALLSSWAAAHNERLKQGPTE
jgi:hypothetical protein